MARRAVKATDRYIVVVEGRGQFPVDMLRYDGAWPHSSDDAALVAQATYGADSTVNLMSTHYPNVARWRSFGWRVQCVWFVAPDGSRKKEEVV